MRPALFLIPLLMLTACGPSEKPADVATAAEAQAAEAAASQISFVASSEDAGTCSLEIGEQAAQKLIERCTTLSPGICNADQSCKRMREEIKQACDNLPINRQLPAECG